MLCFEDWFGTIRFCVHYRKLSAFTVCDVYPMSRMNEILDKVGGCIVYFTKGYWQVSLDSDDRRKSAFITS